MEKYWKAVGLSGFVVYKFALKRCSDQAPPPWLDELEVGYFVSFPLEFRG